MLKDNTKYIILGIISIIEIIVFALFVYLKAPLWVLIVFVLTLMCTIGGLLDNNKEDD